MQSRSPVLQNVLDSLHEAILAGTSVASPAAQAATRIFGALESPSAPGDQQPVRLPVAAYLGEALMTARSASPAMARIAAVLAEIEPSVTWARRAGAEADPAFADGHSNTTLVGPNGLERRKDVWVGLSLMAPGVRYPDHRHPPEEVYVVLSPGEWRQDDGPWFEPGVGGIIYNPPNILHAMRSGPAPLLAAWCLWLGG